MLSLWHTISIFCR